jgi:hypothetical protein
MAKKTVVTVSVENQTSRCVPKQRFRADFPTVAGIVGAPSPPTNFDGAVTSVSSGANEKIEEDIQRIYKNDGLVCIIGFIVTSIPILLGCITTNALVVAQKFLPNDETTKLYRRLKCAYRRDQLPGNIFSHLVRRDGQEDFGIMDGFRFLGNYYYTTRKFVNEMRNFAHTKLLIGLLPEKKKKGGEIVLVPSFSWNGSANFSHNADHSFELMQRSQDAAYVKKLFDLFGYYWSLSEGMHNFAPGLTPTYTWLDKPAAFGHSPACPKCGSLHMFPVWMDSEFHAGEAVRKLQCLESECKEQIPFLNEYQQVTR